MNKRKDMTMKEHPILFSTPMVRAILEGRKTKTRRVAKPETVRLIEECMGDPLFSLNVGLHLKRIKPPYAVGDRFWVRETFAPFVGAMGRGAIYKADDVHATPLEMCLGNKWRPSIHMPRWASRITLEVTGVRAQRLQDITPEDAWEEGFEHIGSFEWTWDSLYAKRGLGWEANHV